MTIGGPTPGKAQAVAFVDTLNNVILFPLIALLTTVAIVIFIYGAFEYVMNADTPAARETGRSHMIWGIIGILVMLGAYSILEIATGSFSLLPGLEAIRDPNKSLQL